MKKVLGMMDHKGNHCENESMCFVTLFRPFEKLILVGAKGDGWCQKAVYIGVLLAAEYRHACPLGGGAKIMKILTYLC